MSGFLSIALTKTPQPNYFQVFLSLPPPSSWSREAKLSEVLLEDF